MKAVLNTSMGVIEIKLDQEKAPLSVQNFVNYVKSGHYDGTIFHRVIKDFMIQGGGFDKSMHQKPTKSTISNEANNGLQNSEYTIAMARTTDPHSATSQFFINVSDNKFLNFKSEDTRGWGYAVFGAVVAGTDVIDKIEQVKTMSHAGHDDVPVEAVIIETVTII